MSFLDAAHVLDDLNDGRTPDIGQAVRGLQALDPLLLRGGGEKPSTMLQPRSNSLLPPAGPFGLYVSARNRAGAMADAVRREMDRG